jgi:hypothetical protein
VDVRKEVELKLLLELATLELEVLEVDVVDFGGVQPPITDGTALTPAVIGMMFVPQLAACARRTLALSWSYTTIHHQLFAQPSEHGYLLYADRMNESPKRKNSVLGTAANQHWTPSNQKNSLYETWIVVPPKPKSMVPFWFLSEQGTVYWLDPWITAVGKKASRPANRAGGR